MGVSEAHHSGLMCSEPTLHYRVSVTLPADQTTVLQGDLEGVDCPPPLDKVCNCGKQAGKVDAAPSASSSVGGLAHGNKIGSASKRHL